MTRRILICTLGNSPQIATETADALMHDAERPWWPTLIELITTSEGLTNAARELLKPDGWLTSLFAEGAPPVHIYVPRRNSDGAERPFVVTWAGGWHAAAAIAGLPSDIMTDVATATDTEIMGDLIKNRIWEWTRQAGTQVHVSIAGGRKTMSAHALLSLALVGRPIDGASHVLVEPEFEGLPDFWHRRQGKLLNSRSERRVPPAERVPPSHKPANVSVTLVRVPTPILPDIEKPDRDYLGRMKLSVVAKQIEACNRFLSSPQVIFDDNENKIVVNGIEASLTQTTYALLRFLAAARKGAWGESGEGWVSIDWLMTQAAGGNDLIGNHMVPIITNAYGGTGRKTTGNKDFESWLSLRESLKTLVGGQVTKASRPKWNSIKDDLRDLFGSYTDPEKDLTKAFGPWLAKALLNRPRSRFRLGCDASAIRIMKSRLADL